MNHFLKSTMPAPIIERLQELLDESARSPELGVIGLWCETNKVLLTGLAAGGRLLHWQLAECPTEAEAKVDSDVLCNGLAHIVKGVTASQQATALINRVRH